MFLQESFIDVFSVRFWDLQARSGEQHAQLTSLPGHPIHVKLIVFLHPDRAETRPPEDI